MPPMSDPCRVSTLACCRQVPRDWKSTETEIGKVALVLFVALAWVFIFLDLGVLLQLQNPFLRCFEQIEGDDPKSAAVISIFSSTVPLYGIFFFLYSHFLGFCAVGNVLRTFLFLVAFLMCLEFQVRNQITLPEVDEGGFCGFFFYNTLLTHTIAGSVINLGFLVWPFLCLIGRLIEPTSSRRSGVTLRQAWMIHDSVSYRVELAKV